MVFVHCEEGTWFLPAVDRMLHGLMVFAAEKEKSVRCSQDDILIWSEPFEDFNNPRLVNSLARGSNSLS